VEAPFNKVSVSAGASTSRRKSFVPTHGTVSKFTYPIDTTLQNFTNPAWKAEKIDNRNPKLENRNSKIEIFRLRISDGVFRRRAGQPSTNKPDGH